MFIYSVFEKLQSLAFANQVMLKMLRSQCLNLASNKSCYTKNAKSKATREGPATLRQPLFHAFFLVFWA